MWLAVSKVRISNLGLNGALCVASKHGGVASKHGGVASKQGGTHGERWSSLHHHPCPLPHTADLASGHCKSGGIMKEGGKEGEEEGKLRERKRTVDWGRSYTPCGVKCALAESSITSDTHSSLSSIFILTQLAHLEMMGHI